MDIENQNKRDYKPEIGRGCAFCNSETDGCGAIPCQGCFKLHETPWLDEFPENNPSEIVEVRFKNTRRSFYQNATNGPLKCGDIVAVEASPGHDIGVVSLTGDLVARQMRRTGFNPYNGEFKKIYRKAKPFDIERWQEAIALEHETMIAARQIAADMGLNMKIGDVEYQGDKIKAIFYYIADERVDFRELIKVFAERFHIRIEMKQIGARQEAGRIGGLGACGRELCCASWMSSFSSVTTGAARAQELSLNPQKLAGQCSKLKCCMMYEYDTYVDARKEFPRIKEPLQALDGEYYLVKSDILGGTMTFSSSKDVMVNVTTLPVARVKEIIAMNRAGKKVDQLLTADALEQLEEEPSYTSGSEEDSITRFDHTKRRKKNRNRKDRQQGDRQQGDRQQGEVKTADKDVSAKETANPRQNQGGQEKSERNDRRSRRNNARGEQKGNRTNEPRNDSRNEQRNEQRGNDTTSKPAPLGESTRQENTPDPNNNRPQREGNRQRRNRPQREGNQERREGGNPDRRNPKGRGENGGREGNRGENREGGNREGNRTENSERRESNREGGSERKEGGRENREGGNRPENRKGNNPSNGHNASTTAPANGANGGANSGNATPREKTPTTDTPKNNRQ